MKRPLLIAVIAGLLGGMYLFRDYLPYMPGSPKRQVDIFLETVKSESPNPSIQLGTDFLVDLIGNYNYFKIDKWKLTEKENTPDRTVITVNGQAINAFGASLVRNPSFVLEKGLKGWEITNSYNFFVFEGIPEDLRSLSDHEKHELLAEVKYNLKIENWSWNRTYGNSVEGKGVIVNNAKIPVDFIKVKIEYFDKSEQLVNTDESYAVTSTLMPGEKRQFSWYSGNCYGCSNARISVLQK